MKAIRDLRPQSEFLRAISHRPARTLIYYIAAALLAVVFLFPVVWPFLTSLKSAGEAGSTPTGFFPSQISFENYSDLLVYGAGIVTYVANSAFVTLLTMIGSTILGTLAGYGFSRFRFPGRNIVFFFVLLMFMIPFQSLLTPLFQLLNKMHLINSLVGLSLVYITYQMPFSIFMMRNSFDSIVRDIEDAARIDGCSAFTSLTRVMLPIVRPGIITIALFAFFGPSGAWNEFLAALTLLSDGNKFTLPIMLLNAQSGQLGIVHWGTVEAGTTIAMFIPAITFLLLQRYYVQGLTAGSVKA